MCNDLKPCPFCGGEAIIRTYRTFIDEYHGIGTKYYVECSECLANRHLGKLTENEAIEAWNTRVERTCHPVEKFSEDLPFPVMVCSDCGRPLHYDEFREMDYQPYCGCGAKVVSE